MSRASDLRSGHQAVTIADAGACETRNHLVESLRPVTSINPAKASLEICPQRLELCSAIWMCSSLGDLSFGGHTERIGQSTRQQLE
jgi:hypothetical protein